MNYVFDTSILIDLARGQERITNSLRELEFSNAPFITMLTFAEYYYGFLSKPKQIVTCLDFLGKFEKLTISEESAKTFADLNHKYKGEGLSFGAIDLLNASIAIEGNLIFVTSDRKFEKIRELKKLVIVR